MNSRYISGARCGASRRTFLKGAAAGVALAGSAAAPLRAQGARGGTLRIGFADAGTADSLDPRTGADTLMSQCLSGAVRNNLTVVDKNQTLRPELAEHFESSDGAKVWRFDLRKDVEFHNGKTLTAEDVAASINLHRGETQSSAAALFETVESIETDRDGLTIRLSVGSADLPYFLSTYQLSIHPSEDGAAQWRDGVGTAGYVLETFSPGERASVSRNPNYWKSDAAFVDACELLALADPVARTTALLTDTVDVIASIPVDLVSRLEAAPGVRIGEVTGTRHFTLPMHCDVAPFDEVDVRLALKYAFPREEMLEKILFGHGALGNDSPIAPANQFYHAEMTQRLYDPDRARHHLRKAGREGLKVQLHAADAAFPDAVDTAVLFQAAAKEAGIEIEVVREPNDGYWSDVWLKKPFCTAFWSGRPTEDWMFTQAYSTGAKWNDSRWNNARFNALLLEARIETDTERRRGLYHEMQEIVRDDGGVIIPVFANYVFGLRDRVSTNGPVSGSRGLDGARVCERWSFA